MSRACREGRPAPPVIGDVPEPMRDGSGTPLLLRVRPPLTPPFLPPPSTVAFVGVRVRGRQRGAMAGPREVVTLQLGHYAGSVGAHWWGLQVSGEERGSKRGVGRRVRGSGRGLARDTLLEGRGVLPGGGATCVVGGAFSQGAGLRALGAGLMGGRERWTITKPLP